MRATEIFHFSSRILMRRKGRAVIVSASIGIGVMVMLLFLSFASGVEQAVLSPILDQSSPTTLVVRPNYKSLEFLTGSAKITPEEIREVENIPHVASVGRQLTLGFPNSLEISLFNYQFETDVPVFGIDAAIVVEEITDFAPAADYLPVVVSPRLVDIFNTAFGDQIPGIPRITQEFVIGRNLTLIVGKSTFFKTQSGTNPPETINARVVGISGKVPPVGIAIPLESALAYNQTYGGVSPENAVYQQLLVEAESLEAVADIESQIKKLGMAVQSFDELGREVRLMVSVIRFILFFASAVILLVAFFSLFSLVSISIFEQQRNIGILRALGASRAAVGIIFLGEALILTLFGILCGFLMGYLASLVMNIFLLRLLPELTFLPGNFFPISFYLLIKLLVGVLLAAIIFAFLPVRHMIKKDPLAALWG